MSWFGRGLLAGLAFSFLLAHGSASASELPNAAQQGDREGVRALLANGADVAATQADGATALHWATYHEDLDMVAALLAAGADPMAANAAGKTPLVLAAETGNVRLIDALLESGADPNAPMRNGETPLMFAARTGKPEVLEVLIEAGAEIEAREELRGTTPLMWASYYGSVEAVEVLVRAGADIGAQSGPAPLGRNPRVSNPARERIKNFIEGVGGRGDAVLLDEDGNPVELDEDGNPVNPDQVVAYARAGSPVPVDSMGREVDLRAHPHLAQLVQEDVAGVERRELVRTRQILEEFLEVEYEEIGDRSQAGGGLTPLVYAARIGDIESAEILLEAGADVNQTTRFRVTPLLAAVQNGYYEMAHFLLDRGADPNIDNLEGWTPLYIAVHNRNRPGGDYPSRRPDADDFEMIVRLLEEGADPNARMRSSTESYTVFTNPWLNEEGATAFLRAAHSGDLDTLHLLLEYGADPSIPTYHGVTPLMVASGIGWVDGITHEHSPEQTLETVKFLLELGADVNHQDWIDYRTALMGAAHKGRVDVARVLLDHGADPGLYNIGSRDTIHLLGGVVWQAIDYADGLVRVGVQQAQMQEEVGALLREEMRRRGMDPPPANRTLESVCVPSAIGVSMC